jgi:hypothetical protein
MQEEYDKLSSDLEKIEKFATTLHYQAALDEVASEIRGEIQLIKLLMHHGMENTMGYFSILPLEMIEYILRMLDLDSLSRITVTCNTLYAQRKNHKLYGVAPPDEPPTRQEIIAMCERLRGPVTTSDCIKLLYALTGQYGRDPHWCTLVANREEEDNRPCFRETCIDGYYYGDMKNGRMHGFGVRLMALGTIYIGHHANDHAHGVGWRYYSTHDEEQRGTFFEDSLSGECVIVKRGCEIKATFSYGAPHGTGAIKWKLTKYKGIINNAGEPHIYGKFTRECSDYKIECEGQIRDCKVHGKGVTHAYELVGSEWVLEYKFAGEHKNGAPHRGTCWYSDNTYFGKFKKSGARHGKGMLQDNYGVRKVRYDKGMKTSDPLDRKSIGEHAPFVSRIGPEPHVETDDAQDDIWPYSDSLETDDLLDADDEQKPNKETNDDPTDENPDSATRKRKRGDE